MRHKRAFFVRTIGLFGVLFLHGIVCAVAESRGYAALSQQLLQKYGRPITVLMVGDYSHYYTCKIAQHFDVTCVSALTRDAHLLHDRVLHNQLDNVVILAPSTITAHQLVMLGSCEHFDVVLVRDLAHVGNGATVKTIEQLLYLGDFIVVEMPSDLFEQLPEVMVQDAQVLVREEADMLVLFPPHRKTLDLPRWNARERKAGVNYEIQSSFLEKKLYKEPACATSDWVRGINLITFIMMHGSYPTNEMIQKQLQSFKRIAHNDLVVGNIIVQGARIKPIDFGDTRRNIDPRVCVKAALGIFNNTKRFKDPTTALEKYSKYIKKNKRGMRS